MVELHGGLPWQLAYLDALHAQAAVWGGSGNLVLPLDRAAEHPSPLVGALIDRFDPDALAIHRVTNGALEWLAPRMYRDRREGIAADLQGQWLDEWHGELLADDDGVFPDVLVGSLASRISVLPDGSSEPLTVGLTSSDPPPWPATDLNVVSGVSHTVDNPIVALGDNWRLAVATEFGELSPGVRKRLTQVTTLREEEITDASQTIRLLTGAPLPTSSGVPVWAQSEAGLQSMSPIPRVPRPGPALVAGAGPEDFSLYYALRRWTGAALWLPPDLLAGNEHLWAMVIRSLARKAGRNPVRITGSSPAAVDELHERLSPLLRQGEILLMHDPVACLPEKPSRLFARPFSQVQRTFLVRDSGTVPLATPIPDVARARRAGEVSWVSEVWVDGWAPVRHSALAEHLFSTDAGPYAFGRASRDGPAYLCPHWGVFTTSVDDATVRPRLATMTLLDQLQAILAPHGWQIRVSDKGVFARETAILAGGWRTLCSLLGSPAASAALNAFRSSEIGVELSAEGGRRYATRDDLVLVIGGEDADMLDRLSDLGMLERGLILKCGRCRQASWFRLGQFGATFACRRCGLEQELTSGAWLAGPEPVWHYRPAEVVFQLLGHNGHVPLRAVEFVADRHRGPVALTHELELVDGQGETFELDIAMSIGTELLIGEATVRDHFGGGAKEKKRFARLHHLANLVNATTVLLATTAPAFRDATLKAAQAIIGGRLLTVTGPASQTTQASKPG